jgi:hypothetical protein
MRYFIGFIITIGLIVILIVMLFSGGSDKAKVPTTSKPLSSYVETGSEARLTIDGPLNAESEHRQIQISVDSNRVMFTEIGGYNGNVISQKSYSNNTNAYRNFLAAVGRAGFTKGSTDSQLSNELGYCPTGNRYIYELKQGDKSVERFWSTSCSKPKTYLGNQALTNHLFEAQVPDYDGLSSTVSLN